MADILNLHPEVRRRLDAMVREWRELGYRPVVTSGYRDPAKQAQLYAAFRRGESKFPVAPPGRSTHNYGFAVDVVVPGASADDLNDVAADADMVWAGSRDWVHFDPFGFALWQQILNQ